MSLICTPPSRGFIGCGAVDTGESLGNLQGVHPAAILGRSFSAYAGLTQGCDRAFRRGNRPRSHTLVGVRELLLVFKGSPVWQPAIESCHWRACMVNKGKRKTCVNGCGKNPSRSKLPPRFQLPSLARLRVETNPSKPATLQAVDTLSGRPPIRCLPPQQVTPWLFQKDDHLDCLRLRWGYGL